MRDYGFKVYILIPVFNPGGEFIDLLKRIRIVQPELPMVVVDDGSALPVNIPEEVDYCTLLRNEKNLGKGDSLLKGVKYLAEQTDCTHVLTMDGDLQHLPEDIPAFLSRCKTNRNALIYGQREFCQSDMPFHRILSNTMTSFLISIRINQRVYDSQTGFRLFPIKLMSGLTFCYKGFQLESEFLIRIGLARVRLFPVRISTVYGTGHSHINHLMDTIRFIFMYIQSFLWV